MFHFRLAKLISFDLHSNMAPMIKSLAYLTAFQTKHSTLRRRYKTRLVVWATWGIWEVSNCKKGRFSRKDHRYTRKPFQRSLAVQDSYLRPPGQKAGVAPSARAKDRRRRPFLDAPWAGCRAC